MVIFRIILCFISLSIFVQPSYSDCGDATPNQNDKECAGTCSGTSDDPKGCFYVTTTGAPIDSDCDKKTRGKYKYAKGDVCCCESK